MHTHRFAKSKDSVWRKCACGAGLGPVLTSDEVVAI
jgi:hypothetical protein